MAASSAADELLLLEAMYPDDFAVRPLDWHQSDDPQLPASGSALIQLNHKPAVRLDFTLPLSYPSELSVNLSCDSISRDLSLQLNQWLQIQCAAALVGQSDTPLSLLVGALDEGLEEIGESLLCTAELFRSHL